MKAVDKVEVVRFKVPVARVLSVNVKSETLPPPPANPVMTKLDEKTLFSNSDWVKVSPLAPTIVKSRKDEFFHTTMSVGDTSPCDET